VPGVPKWSARRYNMRVQCFFNFRTATRTATLRINRQLLLIREKETAEDCTPAVSQASQSYLQRWIVTRRRSVQAPQQRPSKTAAKLAFLNLDFSDHKQFRMAQRRASWFKGDNFLDNIML
jgi:hypothetical protein